MIALKPGVKLSGMMPQTLLGIVVADQVYAEHGFPSCVVTSVNDGNHSHTSLHYSGQAFDLRTRTLPRGASSELAKIIKERLGRDFDVLDEDPGGPNEHIHVEYQPRR